MYKGVNLLDYNGPKDYAAVDRFLARKILSEEDRIKVCWFCQRSNSNFVGREMASKEDEFYFRGFISILIFLFRKI